jgi:hypothetical protein
LSTPHQLEGECTQDDQVGEKIMGLADIARLPHLINTKKFIVLYKRPSPPAGTTPTLNFELDLQGLHPPKNHVLENTHMYVEQTHDKYN